MKIAVIGAGNMAYAIIKSVKDSERMATDIFYAYDKSEEQLKKISLLGSRCCNSLAEAVIDSDFVLLSVKPQDLDNVILSIKNDADFSKLKFVSICAGISTDYICRVFGEDVPVIRVMPNAPLTVGAGATAITRNNYINDKDFSKICGLFSFGGEVAVIPESQMNAVISVNSSSPAYFFEFIRIMVKYAVSQGIDEKIARSMAQNAMYGASKMLLQNDKTPEELINIVASKKGTTEAALQKLESNDFEKTIFEAMDACTARAFELGK